MSLREAAYENEQRIKALEADIADLKYITRKLWQAQFAPLNKADKADINSRMREHGIEVYP